MVKRDIIGEWKTVQGQKARVYRIASWLGAEGQIQDCLEVYHVKDNVLMIHDMQGRCLSGSEIYNLEEAFNAE
jgi:hypothetical protein